MENEEVFTLTKSDIICRAYDAMRDCSAYLNNGSRRNAARARGVALEWEFILFFNMGVDDSEWKDPEYERLVNRAEAANL